MKTLINDIESLIDDALSTTLKYLPTAEVPNVEDTQLTFGFGGDKKGKIINTCVLYVDVRNSVGLVKKHQFNTMGKIYSAFTTIVLKIAKHHKANVRNIIGDRVMLVFPENNCFTNAVDAAISINHAAIILNNKYSTVDFKCGIGIDFGEMRILKVGIKINGSENYDNKNLVWVGYPANHASRLTDVANKSVDNTYVRVKLKRWNLSKYFPSAYQLSGLGLFNNEEYIYEEKNISESEFLSQIKINESGKMRYQSSDVIEYEYMKKTTEFQNILMTKSVYNGFASVNKNRKSVKNNYWKKVNYDFSEIEEDIYGGFVTWEL